MAKLARIGPWACLLVLEVSSLQITEEQYFAMPRLFHLDDYDECMGRAGTFCLGTFELRARTPSPLMDVIREYSSLRYTFNHTLLHRGYCIPSRCSDISEPNITARFEQCVSSHISKQYGFQARLLKLGYCKTSADPPKPIDSAEVIFACVTLLIALLNVVGTTYDVMHHSDEKSNPYLMAWSLRENWRRFTASHEGGNPRFSAPNAVYGLRGFIVLFVSIVHSGVVHYSGYLQNPRSMENVMKSPVSMFFQNTFMGTQLLFVLSSYLFAYNVLVYAETAEEKPSLRLLPGYVARRVCRLLPVHLFMVGLMGTWWVRAGDGALWGSLMVQEAANCRAKWWAHALFIHNLYKPEEQCLVQSWYLGVDMQLFVPVAALTLILVSRPEAALRVILPLLVAVYAVNYNITYHWEHRPLLQIITPESARVQGVGLDSLLWSYMAPWGSLFSAIVGVGLAFVFHRQQQASIKPESTVFLLLYKLYFPLTILWVLAGLWVPLLTYKPAWVLYETLERPVFALYTAAWMLGLFHNIDSLLRRFLLWGGWRPLGRMSLSFLMVHWSYHLTQVALHPALLHASVFTIGGHWLVAVVLSTLTALPLHLCLEVPVQKLGQALLA